LEFKKEAPRLAFCAQTRGKKKFRLFWCEIPKQAILGISAIQ
jgi:hypothetical protein